MISEQRGLRFKNPYKHWRLLRLFGSNGGKVPEISQKPLVNNYFLVAIREVAKPWNPLGKT